MKNPIDISGGSFVKEQSTKVDIIRKINKDVVLLRLLFELKESKSDCIELYLFTPCKHIVSTSKQEVENAKGLCLKCNEEA